MERFICIHGHFYQPPRENPWTGVIDRQTSAAPDHDWNRRIARECYLPNGAAKVGEETLNNYAYLSFNFGPTLLTWFEKAFPREYRRLIEADKESLKRLDGHGNAIAQAYNHMIMPLANRRDKVTQVRWGVEDFKFRFGREPEGLWLPETAVNDETLKVLIDHKIKFVILAPGQAKKIRPLGSADWTDVGSGGLDPKRPYRWLDGKRHIDIFFYDGPISSAIGFEKLMSDAVRAAERFAGAFDAASKSSQLVSAATDGETYGHHHKFAEMGLAHCFKHEFPKRGLTAVNYGYYLAQHHPRYEVVLKPGSRGLGTAWSCAHGVGRWSEDCGCAAEGGRHQKWRAPLREALDFLRDRLAAIFEEEGGKVFHDPWAARDGYIRALLDPANLKPFMDEHLREGASRPGPFGSGTDAAKGSLLASSERALKLLELQKNAMFMYTSCGWFFSEISGIEAVQNLKYAAKALELARDVTGKDLEPQFEALLALAPSNEAQFKDGRGVYEKLARPPKPAPAAARHQHAH